MALENKIQTIKDDDPKDIIEKVRQNLTQTRVDIKRFDGREKEALSNLVKSSIYRKYLRGFGGVETVNCLINEKTIEKHQKVGGVKGVKGKTLKSLDFYSFYFEDSFHELKSYINRIKQTNSSKKIAKQKPVALSQGSTKADHTTKDSEEISPELPVISAPLEVLNENDKKDHKPIPDTKDNFEGFDEDKEPSDISLEDEKSPILRNKLLMYGLSLLVILVLAATLFYFNKNDDTLSAQEQLQLDELQKLQPDDPSFSYTSDSILSLRRTTGISNIVIFPKNKNLSFAKSLKYSLDSLKIKDSISISTYINKHPLNATDSLYRNMHYKHIDYVIIEKDNNNVQLLFPQTLRSIANPKMDANNFQSGAMDGWLSALSNISIQGNNRYLCLWVGSNLHSEALHRLKYLDRIKKDFPKKQLEQNYLLHKTHILKQLVSVVHHRKEDPIWEDIYAIHKQLLFLNPQTNDHYIEYASYKKSKDRFLAEELITKSIALRDSSLFAMQYLDRAFLRSNYMQKHQEALSDFQTAYHYADNEVLKLHILRRAINEKLEIKDYKGAIDDYQILAEKDTTQGFHYYIKIADCYNKMELENQALQYYTKYLDTYKARFPKGYKNDETIGQAYSSRSSIYLKNLDFNAAMKDIDSARLYRFNSDIALVKEISTLRKQLKHKTIISRLKGYKAKDTYKQKMFDSLSKLLNRELILLKDNQLNNKQKDSIRHTELTDDPYFTKLFFYGSTFKKDAFFMQ